MLADTPHPAIKLAIGSAVPLWSAPVSAPDAAPRAYWSSREHVPPRRADYKGPAALLTTAGPGVGRARCGAAQHRVTTPRNGKRTATTTVAPRCSAELRRGPARSSPRSRAGRERPSRPPRAGAGRPAKPTRIGHPRRASCAQSRTSPATGSASRVASHRANAAASSRGVVPSAIAWCRAYSPNSGSKSSPSARASAGQARAADHLRFDRSIAAAVPTRPASNPGGGGAAPARHAASAACWRASSPNASSRAAMPPPLPQAASLFYGVRNCGQVRGDRAGPGKVVVPFEHDARRFDDLAEMGE